MAIDNDLPSMKSPSVVFTSSSISISSSLLPFNQRKRLIQVATTNSSTFIPLLSNARHPLPFVPICHPRISSSAARFSPHTFDTNSSSNQSKSSAKAQISSIRSSNYKCLHTQQRINPILNNPLLNYRREQPKYPSIKSSNGHTRTEEELLRSSRPLKPISNKTETPIVRANTVPPVSHQNETNTSLPSKLIISIENRTPEQEIQYIDQDKHDYITRWVNEVRAATYSKNFRSVPRRTRRQTALS